jgi:hypothetical protein
MEALRGQEMVEPLLEGLLAHVEGGGGAES